MLAPSTFVQDNLKRIIFLEHPDTSKVYLKQYVYGTEKAIALLDTELYLPKTYHHVYLDETGLEVVKVLASSIDSITLGVYDKSQTTRKPEMDETYYKQIGTKVINLK